MRAFPRIFSGNLRNLSGRWELFKSRVRYDCYVLEEMAARGLYRLIEQLEADASLFEPKRLRKRIEVLDKLDAYFGDSDTETATDELNLALMYQRAKVIRFRLEAANSSIYQSIRSHVQRGTRPDRLLRWTERCVGEKGTPAPGLGYDYLDELMSGVLQLHEPCNTSAGVGPDMVFYQPTPMRHILQLVQLSKLSEDDVLVDLGSGLGHVPIVMSILTGARSIGMEVEAAYVASARDCAERLRLSRVAFVQQDVRDADLSTGTIFYLYTPFTGAILETVLQKLRKEKERRAIKVCTLGPCTSIVAREPWLEPYTMPDTDQITCFQ